MQVEEAVQLRLYPKQLPYQLGDIPQGQDSETRTRNVYVSFFSRGTFQHISVFALGHASRKWPPGGQ